MLALYDFTSRNNKEITVRKGDIVEASTRNLNHKTIVCFFSYCKATKHHHRHHLLFLNLQLLDKTNQWWKVRDSRGEEGYIPHNVLKPNEEEPVPVSNKHTLSTALWT